MRMMGERVGGGGVVVVASCGEVEGVVFPSVGKGGDGDDGVVGGAEEGVGSDSDEDEDEGGGVRIERDDGVGEDGGAAAAAAVGGGGGVGDRAGAGIVEADPRKAGMERARNREMVRQAARRLVAFGARGAEGGQTRAVEAVQGGRVVESSFAKGEWGIRWKE